MTNCSGVLMATGACLSTPRNRQEAVIVQVTCLDILGLSQLIVYDRLIDLFIFKSVIQMLY